MMRRAYISGATEAFNKFALQAGTMGHIAEVAGLGLLTVPTLNHLFGDSEKDSPLKKRVMAGTELAGLGVLAAPSLHHLIRK